jgi:hypothetical protein
MIHEGLMKRFFHNDVDHNKNPTIRKTVDVKVKRATGGVAALRKDVIGTSVTVTHLLVIISRMVRNGVGMLNFVAFTASDALDVCFACSGGMTTGFYKIHGRRHCGNDSAASTYLSRRSCGLAVYSRRCPV